MFTKAVETPGWEARLEQLERRVSDLERATRFYLDSGTEFRGGNRGVYAVAKSITVAEAVQRLKHYLGLEFQSAPYQDPIQLVKVLKHNGPKSKV